MKKGMSSNITWVKDEAMHESRFCKNETKLQLTIFEIDAQRRWQTFPDHDTCFQCYRHYYFDGILHFHFQGVKVVDEIRFGNSFIYVVIFIMLKL